MKKLCLAVSLLLIALLLVGCAKDLPPDDGTPAPKALDGTFLSTQGILVFNGDGRSIRFQLTEEFSELTGLPSGEQEGTYVFLFHNEEYRYDKAEYFRIILGEKQWQFSLPVGQNDGTLVAFFTPDGDLAVFEKE